MSRPAVLSLTALLTALILAGCSSGAADEDQPRTATPAETSAQEPSPTAPPTSTPAPSRTTTPTEEPTATPTPTPSPVADPSPLAPTTRLAPAQPPAPTATPTAPPASYPSVAAVAASTFANAWSPPAVDIAAGGTVTWSWGGGPPHSVEVASTSSGIPAQAGGFTYTFSAPGSYTFACPVHPGMGGTVRAH